jgi:hypothetical protein
MELPMRTLNDYFIPFYIADVSTAGQVYCPVPDAGKIIKIMTSLNGAIGTADVDITAKIGGTAVTGGVVTIATASSAAGDQDSASPTAANDLVEGSVLEIETDGASTNTVSVHGVVVVRR